MGIASEFRARTLSGQAANWTTFELNAALDGLVELDAAVKGAQGLELDEAQRRLAFTLWVIGPRRTGRRPSGVATSGPPQSGRASAPGHGTRAGPLGIRLVATTAALAANQSADDQACSWTTRSLSMANTQRPSPRSSSSISSGSI